jgi:tripartite-type tricarboxylate transporter receptor subunit TctC
MGRLASGVALVIAAAALATPALAATLATPAPDAGPVADFYRERRIEFVVGSEPGAAYDIWTRLISRHMGKHIPGSPTFIVRNMPGAGHVTATNYLYGQAARDGSVVAMVSRDMPSQQLRGNKAVAFKMGELNWLGSPQASNRLCFAMAGVKVQKAEDLFKDELLIAGSGASTSAAPNLIRELLGMKLKVVEGYPSVAASFLALERGEAEGICQNLGGTEAVRPGWVAAGKVKALFNMEKKRLIGVPGIDAPSIHEFTKTEEQRQILSFFNSTVEMGWPMMTMPAVPKERVGALRRAFDATMKDPAFLDEAKGLKFEIDPVKGEELEAVVKGIVSTSKDIIDKTTALVGTAN